MQLLLWTGIESKQRLKRETDRERQRAGNIECCACCRTCWVGWWVVWCHRSHTHSVSVVLRAASFMFTPLMGVTLRPRPRQFEGPFISKFQSVCGQRAGCSANNRCEKWSQSPTFRSGHWFFFILPTLWWNATNAVMLVVWFFDHFSGFPSANFQHPQFSNSFLVVFPGLLHLTAVRRGLESLASAGVPDRFGDGGNAESTANSCTWCHLKRRTSLSLGAVKGRFHAAAPSPAGNQSTSGTLGGTLKDFKSGSTFFLAVCLNYLRVSSRLYYSCSCQRFLRLSCFCGCVVYEPDVVTSLVLQSVLGVQQKKFLLFRFGCWNLLPTPSDWILKVIKGLTLWIIHLIETFNNINTLFVSLLLPLI